MATPSDPVEQRVLIFAPAGRDAQLTHTILTKAGMNADVTPDVVTLCREIDRGAGALIVTAEALDPAGLQQLERTLARQPQWSELPMLVFVADTSRSRFELPRAQVTLVDRPIHMRTLISAAESALRSRSRQYEIRELLTELENAYQAQHAERLSRLAEASNLIASALSVREVLRMITDEARKLIGANLAVSRVAVDPRNTVITSAACSDAYKEWESAAENGSADAAAVADLINAPVRTTEAEHLLEVIFPCEHPLPPPRGLLAAPLVERDGRAVGYIALSSKEDAEFSIEDEAVLVQLAQIGSAAVQNTRLYREAEEANRAKDEFLATLAHELRTPMTAILGWVQMLKQEGIGPEDAAGAIRMIEASTRVQARLVEDLLDVSRIIAGKLTLTPEAVELGHLLENIIPTFRKAAEEKGLVLNTLLDPHPLSVWGDPVRLQQVVWNLLSNAIKFTPPGGEISVDLHRENGNASLTVSDTGQGISPEFLPFVFDRFRQAETGTTRSHGGLGLGLAIVRHLVEMHGGVVEAKSEGAGKGAEFVVRLPLTAVQPKPPRRDHAEPPQLHGKKILLVDDDRNARESLIGVLSDAGAEVRAAASVSEAFQVLQQFEADLIISDIAMPGEDGYALLRRLREIESQIGKDIPALALTGYGRPEERTRILRSGFDQYVQKPVDPVELARIAADLLTD